MLQKVAFFCIYNISDTNLKCAINVIYELIIKMARQGKTIVVVSSEMPEILGITNRIGVMSNGHLAGIVNTKDTNQEELLRLSAKYL